MADFIVAFIIVAIVGVAVAYIVREKKRGVHCVGCPDGGCSCNGGSGCSGCGSNCGEGMQ